MRRRLVAVGATAALMAGGGIVASTSSATGEPVRAGWRSVSAASAAGVTGDASAGTADRRAVTAADDAGAHERVIRLIGTFQRGEFIDVGEEGFSAGDFNVFEETLRDQATGELVGRDSVSCQFIVDTLRCSATFQLFGRGRIEVAGAFFTDRDNVLTVTGGTGEFKGVGGTFRFFPTDDFDDTRFAILLVGGAHDHH